jgi:hypothetical protein
MTFGITGDFEHMPEVDLLASAIDQAIDELAGLYREPQKAAPKRARKPRPAAPLKRPVSKAGRPRSTDSEAAASGKSGSRKAATKGRVKASQ